MWLGQCLLQESTTTFLVFVHTVMGKTKTNPEMVANTCTYHNGGTKEDNNKETERTFVRAGRV